MNHSFTYPQPDSNRQPPTFEDGASANWAIRAWQGGKRLQHSPPLETFLTSRRAPQHGPAVTRAARCKIAHTTWSKSPTGCRAPGGIRTPNLQILNLTPLPIRLPGQQVPAVSAASGLRLWSGPHSGDVVPAGTRSLLLDHQQIVAGDQVTVRRSRLHKHVILRVDARLDRHLVIRQPQQGPHLRAAEDFT